MLECSGAPGSFSQAARLARRNGTVGLIGFYEDPEREVDVDRIVTKALTLFGVMGEFGNMTGALALLAAGRPDLSPIITGERDFDDCLDAFLRKNTPNAIKTMVRICGE